MKLEIQPIPFSQHNRSLYRYFKINKYSIWRKTKDKLIQEEGMKCWTCDSIPEEKKYLEAHEFWNFDKRKGIQKLVAIHHLCSKCHKVVHFEFFTKTEDGKVLLMKENLTEDDLIQHFCNVNSCSTDLFKRHYKMVINLVNKLNNILWKQDFSIIGEYAPPTDLLKWDSINKTQEYMEKGFTIIRAKDYKNRPPKYLFFKRGW